LETDLYRKWISAIHLEWAHYLLIVA
jgi:hypothetical protein